MSKNKVCYFILPFALLFLSISNGSDVRLDGVVSNFTNNLAHKSIDHEHVAGATLADEHGDHSEGWVELTSTGQTFADGSYNFFLSEDVVDENGAFKLNSSLIIGTGVDVSLCLNGFVLIGADGSIPINVSGGVFTLYDCSQEESGTIYFYSSIDQSDNYDYTVIYANNGATITINSGTLSQIYDHETALLYDVETTILKTTYGVIFGYSTQTNYFTMNGGYITDIRTTGTVAGIYTTMTGITDIVIDGGTISNINSTTDSNASSGSAYAYGIYHDVYKDGSSLTINSGSIKDITAYSYHNTAPYAYGIYHGATSSTAKSLEIDNLTVENITATPSIASTGSYAYGIHAGDGATDFKISNTTITNVTGINAVYGIYQGTNSTMQMDNVNISNVSTTSSSGYTYGIFQRSNSTLEISDTTLTNITSNHTVYGLFTGTCDVTLNGLYLVSLSAINAYGIWHEGTTSQLTINGGVFIDTISSSGVITVNAGYFDDTAFADISNYVPTTSIYINLNEVGGVSFDSSYDSLTPHAVYIIGIAPTITASIDENEICVDTDYEDKIAIVDNTNNVSYSFSYREDGDTTEYNDLPTEIGDYIIIVTFSAHLSIDDTFPKEYYEATTCEFSLSIVDHTPSGRYSYDNQSHWQECARCETIVEEEHTLSTSYESNGTTHWKVCTICENIVNEEEHTSSTTYETNETSHWNLCTYCGVVLNEIEHALGDTYQMNETSHRRVCDDCETTVSEEHIYNEYNNYEYYNACIVCGYIRPSSATTSPNDSAFSFNWLYVVIGALGVFVLINILVLILVISRRKKHKKKIYY